MNVTVSFSPLSIPPVFDARTIGEAIFSEWYPNWRDGDVVPVDPPAAVVAEARELARRHLRVETAAALASPEWMASGLTATEREPTADMIGHRSVLRQCRRYMASGHSVIPLRKGVVSRHGVVSPEDE